MITHVPVKKGTTDVSCTIRVWDSTDGTPETGVTFETAGIDLWYRRGPVGAVTSITEVTLAAVTTAHADGGFIHVGNGYCRLDLPDAACAAGTGDYVEVGGTFTGMIVTGCIIPLTAVDLQDTVRGGMTALPNAAADAAGGLPISDAGELDLDAMDTNISSVLTDTGTAGVVIADSGISSGKFAAGAITADAIAANALANAKFADNAISAGKIAADALSNAKFANDAISAAKLATGAIASDALAASALADIADALWDEVLAGTTTGRELMRGVAAVLLGKASGLATTTAVFRDIADTMNVVTATVDTSGNRSAVALDLDDTP